MKRLFLPGLVVAGLAMILTLVFLVTQAGQNWHPLPGGGKTRVFAVTHGTKHRLRFPTRSWAAHYKKVVFARPLTPSRLYNLVQREHGGSRAVSNTASTVIWFQSDAAGLVSFDATLVTADGQRYHTTAANGATTDGYGYTGLQFPVAATDPTLHLEVSINGKAHRLEIPNSASAVRPQ